MNYPITSATMMQELGRKIAAQYRYVSLAWGVGVWKTTCASWLVQWRWYQWEVTSPTYALMQVYGDKIVHCDMDRLWSADEMIARGIYDAINECAFCIVEHPKWVDMYADDSWLHLTLMRNGDVRYIVWLPPWFVIR